MNYIIYKTTNEINGKYYIGCHQTDNINDGYLGSGKHLRYAIKKYGIDNFKFEILYSVLSKEEMFELERNIVNEDLVKNPQTYNLKIGGSGGNPGIVGAFKGKKHSEETKQNIRDNIKNSKTWKSPWERSVEKYGYDEACRLNSLGDKSGSKGISKSDSHRQKLREASLKNNSGKQNTGKVRIKYTCPHCGEVGAMNTLSRWHFGKCKTISQ
jgi:hypothetical protein